MRLKSVLNEGKNASKTTRLQEGLHCVFFGVMQKAKKVSTLTVKDPDLMQSAYDTYCSVDSPFGELYKFAVDHPKWVDSIVVSTKALFKSGWMKGNYTFHRGDAYMTSIYDQWKRFKKANNIKLGDDKWNPGDVWASKGNVPIPNFDTLDEYNAWVAKMLHSGRLIPISLKQTMGGSTVKLEGDPGDLKAHVKRTLHGIKRPMKIFPTGVSLQVGDGDVINIRSFALDKHKGAITGEIVPKKGGARGGKVPADWFRKALKKYNVPQMSLSTIKSTSDEDLINKVIDMWMDIGHTFPEDKIAAQFEVRCCTGNKKQKWRDRDSYWESLINSMLVGVWAMNAGAAVNDVIDKWYQGAKSKTEVSSQFIKIF